MPSNLFNPNAVPPDLSDEILMPYAPSVTVSAPQPPPVISEEAAKRERKRLSDNKKQRKYYNSPHGKARRRLKKLLAHG